MSTEGSTSMERVIGFLSEGYMEKIRDVRVTYNPTGSAAGLRAAAEGRCDIGLSSRELTADESLMLDSRVLAIDGISVVVNLKNPINDLSYEQLRKIYTGEILNWSEVGGCNKRIVLIGREAASGTRDGFESVIDAAHKCRYTQELTSAGDVIRTVAGNPNAIGYTSYAAVKDDVKQISIDKVSISKQTIQSGEYKIKRNFLLITAKDKELTDAAKNFFDFITSKNADKLIEMSGSIPPIR